MASLRRAWLPSLAALFLVLYVVGTVVGWATNALDGYYGVIQVEPGAQGRLTVVDVASGGPAGRAGLRPGDVIVAVDGESVAEASGTRARRISPGAAPAFRVRPLAIPPGDSPAFRRVIGERSPGERRTLRIERPSSTGAGRPPADATTPVELAVVPDSHLAAPGVVASLLTWNVAGLLALGVGAIVALRRPAEPAARPLLLMGGCFALALALLTWNNRPFSADAGLALAQATVLLLVVASSALLHLFLTFPAPHPLLSRSRAAQPALLRRVGGATTLLYAGPALLALGAAAGPAASSRWAYLVVIAVFALGLIALTRSVLRPPSPIARAQLKWIAAALAACLVALILGPGVNVATAARVEILSPTATVAALALLPLALGVAVLRYRLFDVDLVLRAAMLYPLFAALLAASFIALAVVLGRAAVVLAGPGAADSVPISVLAALLVAAVAQPVHRRLQAGLDRLLFRDRIARQRLLEDAGDVLGRALPLRDVAAFLTERVPQRLGLARSWLVLPLDVTAGGAPPPAPLVAAGEPLLLRLREARRPLAIVAPDDYVPSGLATVAADEPALAPWYAAGARLAFPLRSSPADPTPVDPTVGESAGAAPDHADADRLLGVWLLGPKRSGALSDTEDVAALAQLARHAAVLVDHDRLHRQEAAERQRTARFRRYFSPQIADLIAGERAELATHRRELTVLVAQLQGFAALSETLPPEETVSLLNDYLAAMTDVTFAHGGTLDEYRGDGMVAFFGDPLPQPDHAARSLGAARAMQQRFTSLRQRPSAARLSMGIGLASGWVTAGTIGSAARQEYTVVGDAANVAAGLAAAAGLGEILLSDTTRSLLGEDVAVVSRGEVILPTHRQPVAVFTPVGETRPHVGGTRPSPTRLDPGADAPAPRGAAPADASSVAELLERTPLFRTLSRQERLELAGRLRPHRYRKGALVTAAGGPETGLSIVRSGTVKVIRSLPTGDEAVMNILGAGELIGELALLDGAGDSATVVALEPTDILVLSRQDFLGFLQANPTAATAALGLLSERIRRLGDQLEESYALDLPQRLARRLLALGATHGKRTPDGLTIDLPLTQSDLAGMVGASRQRVNRQLAEWQDRRVLRLGPHGAILLLRPDALEELASQPSGA